MANHTYLHHREDGPCPGCRQEGMDCMYSSLSICHVCGGSEGSLLPFCPERQLTIEEDQQNYKHYCDGTGPFAKATYETLEVVRHTCYWRLFPQPLDKLSLPTESSIGARQLYDAVSDLWNFVILSDLQV